MNVYIIKRNGNPMAATLSEANVELLLEYTRVNHWAQNVNNPKYKNSFEEYKKQNAWSRQCIPLSESVSPTSTIPQAPPSHNPDPVGPKGKPAHQVLPGQKQAHRIQPQTVPTALPTLVEQFKKGTITKAELDEKAALLGYNQTSVDECIAALAQTVAKPHGTTGVS